MRSGNFEKRLVDIIASEVDAVHATDRGAADATPRTISTRAHSDAAALGADCVEHEDVPRRGLRTPLEPMVVPLKTL